MGGLIDSISILFNDLIEQNPEDVCRRALSKYDNIKKCYILSVWGDDYAVYPYESKIQNITKNFQNNHEYLYVFIINYLLKAKDVKLSNEWISEKDMQGGVTFFRGPHKIPTELISSRYIGNVEQFKSICRMLGGSPINMADAGYVFNITSRIPVAVLYWDGDDEFLPESKILYDKSINIHLTLDIIFALSVDICKKIGVPFHE